MNSKLAEEFHAPVFMATMKGLFVYDPHFKQTCQLECGTY
jgi:hypothetical protein